jgi:SAM-dependent methyltransferase
MLAERGFHGVGVEPDADMARVAARNLAPYPAWRVDVSDFDDWQPRADDGSFDLITVAAAWHWIDHERGAQQAERLLRPGGWLAILGYDNEPELEDPDLRRAIDAVYDELAPERSPHTFESSEPIPAGFAFAPPVLREYRGSRDYTTREVVELAQTQSDKLILPRQTRELFLERLAAAIDEYGGLYRHHFVYRLAAVARR